MNPFYNENPARGAAAVDALLRQQNRAAAEGQCNVMQPDATPCNNILRDGRRTRRKCLPDWD